MRDDFLQLLDGITDTLHGIGNKLDKPLIGGAWGDGFVMTSLVSTTTGLHQVLYFVRDASSGAVIGNGSDKQGALQQAREVMDKFGRAAVAQYVSGVQTRRDAEEAEMRRRDEEARKEIEGIHRQRYSAVQSIPRRRRKIFEESDGQCHYCGTALTLDGKWHIEHKMPRALGGGNEPTNLVASCVSCNMKKRDTTDQEFKARMAERIAA